MTVFGRRVAEAMSKKGYTVKELALQSGLSSNTIYSAIGQDLIPNAFTLCCLADALDVTMDWLWGRNGSPRKE